MASYTPNYNLKKPADADTYDIADANGNMDLIDTALHSQNQAIANLPTYKKLSNDVVECTTNSAISSAIASAISVMENSSSAIICLNVTQNGLNLPGGRWTGLLNKGVSNYYSCVFNCYTDSPIYTYNYSNGAETWQELALKSDITNFTNAGNTPVANANCNSLSPGEVFLSTGITNGPSGISNIHVSTRYDDYGFREQIAITFDNRTFKRTYSGGGGWTSWQELAPMSKNGSNDKASATSIATGVSLNQLLVSQVGKLAGVVIEIATTAQIAANTNMFTGCPASGINSAVVYGFNNTNSSIVPFLINAAGQLINKEAIPNGASIRISQTYTAA